MGVQRDPSIAPIAGEAQTNNRVEGKRIFGINRTALSLNQLAQQMKGG
jgi:hypothetical protein